MPIQLQLLEISKIHRNGNTALKVLLSRLSQGSIDLETASLYCKKVEDLSSHDLKDILETVKQSQISPYVAELLFNLRCKNHQQLYQKSFAHFWVNCSFERCFIQLDTTDRLQCCRLVAQWNELGVLEIEGSKKTRVWHSMLEGSEDVEHYMRKNPLMVSLFFNFIADTQFSYPFALKIVRALNRIADILSDQQCNTSKDFCIKNHMWETSHCENIYARWARIQKDMLIDNLPKTDKSAQRKM